MVSSFCGSVEVVVDIIKIVLFLFAYKAVLLQMFLEVVTSIMMQELERRVNSDFKN